MAYEDYSENTLLEYTLRLADTSLILGQRLSEWCGHGPILEQDVAITNISLDLIGQSRMYYQYAADVEGKGRTEDDLAYHRDDMDFRNPFLVEQPNGNWGQTLMRQFLFDAFHQQFLNDLVQSTKIDQLRAIGKKSVKEVNYHTKYSSEWVIRLGDGTEESHEKMQAALDHLWKYTGELVTNDPLDEKAIEENIGVDLSKIREPYYDKLTTVLEKAKLEIPEVEHMQTGAKGGQHSEHLGYVLAELQAVQRAYPGLKW